MDTKNKYNLKDTISFQDNLDDAGNYIYFQKNFQVLCFIESKN